MVMKTHTLLLHRNAWLAVVRAATAGLLLLLAAPVAAQEDASGLSAPAGTNSVETESTRDIEHMDSAPENEERTRIARAEIVFGTTAPIDLALGANLVLFDRFVLGASVGRQIYGSIAGRFSDDLTVALLEPLLSSTWVFRLQGAVRPFASRGPELAIAWMRTSASQGWTASELGLPSSLGSLDASLDMRIFSVELAWPIPLGPIFLRPALGWAKVYRTDLTLDASAATSGQAADAVESARVTVEDTINEYGSLPTVSLAIGARF